MQNYHLEDGLVRLSNAFGPSGFEKEVREVMREMLDGVATLSYDNLGSILAAHSGVTHQPKILLAAHMDEVGLLVRDILPNGCLKAIPLGGWWGPALLAQAVAIRSRRGDHRGVIGAKPPHYMKEEEKKRQVSLGELYIDVGTRTKEETVALGIACGDPVVPAVAAMRLSPEETFMGKAFDDRAGCALLVQIMRELAPDHPNEVIAAGTVQEEVGFKGAKAIISAVRPDLCIVLEGAPADDFPDGGPIIQGRLGAGPQLRRYDPSMIANQHLVDLAIDTACQEHLPFQVAVREGGGTDGNAIQVGVAGGVPSMVLGVPVRYAHSHYGIVHLGDLKAAAQLVKALLYRLNEATVARIKSDPWGR